MATGYKYKWIEAANHMDFIPLANAAGAEGWYPCSFECSFRGYFLSLFQREYEIGDITTASTEIGDITTPSTDGVDI